MSGKAIPQNRAEKFRRTSLPCFFMSSSSKVPRCDFCLGTLLGTFAPNSLTALFLNELYWQFLILFFLRGGGMISFSRKHCSGV